MFSIIFYVSGTNSAETDTAWSWEWTKEYKNQQNIKIKYSKTRELAIKRFTQTEHYLDKKYHSFQTRWPLSPENTLNKKEQFLLVTSGVKDLHTQLGVKHRSAEEKVQKVTFLSIWQTQLLSDQGTSAYLRTSWYG